ncbi:MAG: methyltransferase domain-containing protein [Devosia sp.]|nr:methyltransferase domain-containing protein [Devosia sp.]
MTEQLAEARTVDATMPVVAIERSTYFNEQLRIGGYVYAPRAPLVALEIGLGDGRRFPVAEINLPSPDLTRRFGHRAAACRYAALVAIGPDIVGVLSGRVTATLADGSTISQPLGHEDPTDVAPALTRQFQRLVRERPSGHMLEIGSRERTGPNYHTLVPPGWDYTGFDILAGPNVDIVGDAHRASSFLPNGHFDAAISFAVFEHLLMPWKAAIELNRVMKVGGVGLILAPQTWPLHEEPSDYFRFSKHAWKALFNAATGFEIIATGHGGTAYIAPAILLPATAFGEWHTGALMSGVLFRKTGEATVDWPVALDDVSADQYPA